MPSVTLVRSATSAPTRTGNILLVVEATTSDAMDKNVFVKQRIPKPDNSFSDVFVSIATPVQMEDLDVNSPSADTTYFRCSTISIVCFSAEYADTVWTEIQSEVSMLVDDVRILGDLTVSSPVTISA